MPARHSDQTKIRTRLAELRVDRGVPQRTMAELLGMGLTAYQKLERGEEPNPRLRHLVNAAEVLRVKLDELIEPEWLEWLAVDGHPQAPPAKAVWHTSPSSPLGRKRAASSGRSAQERRDLADLRRESHQHRRRA
jgi:transcriptional regulator with XRE-family HTH domain